ncbi:hypothetical protein ACIOKD_02455 [Streptomyces sp. NPDC087844]
MDFSRCHETRDSIAGAPGPGLRGDSATGALDAETQATLGATG